MRIALLMRTLIGRLHPSHPFLTPGAIKALAMALLAVPVTCLLFLGGAEMAGGDVTGVQHFVQAAPLVAASVLAWRFPRWVGIGLVGIGGVLFVAWAILVAVSERSESSLLVWVVAALVLFVPPIIAGLLLVKATEPVS
jgi:hypothetical protein